MDKVFCKDCRWYEGYDFCMPKIEKYRTVSYDPVIGKQESYKMYNSPTQNKDYNCKVYEKKETVVSIYTKFCNWFKNLELE